MPFTEAEIRRWHADRRAGRTADDLRHDAVSCSHCGIALGAAHADSEFPLCDACDDD